MPQLQGLTTLEARGAALRTLRARLAAAPWADAGARTLEDWARRNFAAQGALLDAPPGPWPPRARTTGREGRGTRPLLLDTGRLQRSLRRRAVPGASPDAAELAYTAPYAVVHHEGRGVPRRALLPPVAQARRLVRPLLEDTLSTLTREAGA